MTSVSFGFGVLDLRRAIKCVYVCVAGRFSVYLLRMSPQYRQYEGRQSRNTVSAYNSSTLRITVTVIKCVSLARIS